MWPSLSSISINDMLIKGKQWDRLPAPVTVCGCWDARLSSGAAFRDLRANKKCSLPSMQTGASSAGTCSIPFPLKPSPPPRPPDRHHEMHKLTAPSCWAAAACGESRKSSCHPGYSGTAAASFLCGCPVIASARQLAGREALD